MLQSHTLIMSKPLLRTTRNLMYVYTPPFTITRAWNQWLHLGWKQASHNCLQGGSTCISLLCNKSSLHSTAIVMEDARVGESKNTWRLHAPLCSTICSWKGITYNTYTVQTYCFLQSLCIHLFLTKTSLLSPYLHPPHWYLSEYWNYVLALVFILLIPSLLSTFSFII